MAREPIRHEPGAVVRARMERAARMRAAGMSWAAIAAKLKRCIGTCLHWPCRYPALWALLYSNALAERDEDAEAESIRTLREMLRVNDAKVQREAARDLLRLMRRHDRRMRAAAAEIEHPLGLKSHAALEKIILALDTESEDARGAREVPAGAGAD
jgi:hypothetical protein